MLFGAGHFAAALQPVLRFFNIHLFRHSFVADHFQYLAGISLLAYVCASVSTVVQNQLLQATIALTVLANWPVAW